MSSETISILVAIGGLGVGMLGAMLTIAHQFQAQLDRRFDKVDQQFDKVDQRFDKVDQRFEEVDRKFDKVDQRFEKLEVNLKGLADEVSEVKISIARLEGPRPHLVSAR